MATPKLDAVHLGLAKGIVDRKTDGSQITSAADDGIQLSANERDYIINQALKKFFTSKVLESFNSSPTYEEAILKLTALFPELIKQATGNLTSMAFNFGSGSTYRDFYLMLEAVVAGEYVDIVSSKDYLQINGGYVAEAAPSTDFPVGVQLGKICKFYPTQAGTIAFTINYLANPVDYANGGSFVRDTGNDIPFSEMWERDLIEAAIAVYYDTVKETM